MVDSTDSPQDRSPSDDSADPHVERESVSLEKLSQSFARLFKDSAPQEAPPMQQEELPAAGPLTPETELPEDEADSGALSPASILEAMLFVGSPDNAPLTAAMAASVMRGVEPAEIHELVEELNRSYAANRCPYSIRSEGAGYRLALRDEHQRLRDKFYGRIRQARLSQAAIEVLAIVAYNEPLSGEEVNRLRGTPSGPLLSQLVRRKLLRLERSQDPPRQTRYYTTRRFLDLFGLDSRADLPQSQDLDRR